MAGGSKDRSDAYPSGTIGKSDGHSMNGLEVFGMAEAFVLIVTIIWIVIGWRAMRAHERIADSIGQFVRAPVQLFEKKDE